MKYDTEAIKKKLREAFIEMDLDPNKIDDATFHLVDWLADLHNWNKICESPKSFTAEEAGTIVTNFLVHVPAHLAAACKLVTDLPVADVFGIGATSEENN